MTEAKTGAGGIRRTRLILPGGVLLLVLAMAITIAGIPVAPLFRPGTWLILVALIVIAAGGALRIASPPDGG